MVTNEVTNVVIAVVEGKEDAEVDVSIRVASRQEEEDVTRKDVGVADIATFMTIVPIPVPSARLRIRNTRRRQLFKHDGGNQVSCE